MNTLTRLRIALVAAMAAWREPELWQKIGDPRAPSTPYGRFLSAFHEDPNGIDDRIAADYGLPDTERGIYAKYDVRRTDGSSEPGGKHHDCDYWVLDCWCDPHARAAMATYANQVEATHPLLAQQLRDRYLLKVPAPLTDAEERQSVVLGALYDFMGFLTSDDHTITVGAQHSVTEIMEAFGEWSKRVGITAPTAEIEAWRSKVGITTPRLHGPSNITSPEQWSATDVVHFQAEKNPRDWAVPTSGEPGEVREAFGGFVKVDNRATPDAPSIGEGAGPHGLTEHQMRAAQIDWGQAPLWATHYSVERYSHRAGQHATWSGDRTQHLSAPNFFELRDSERSKLMVFTYTESVSAKHLLHQLQQMDRVGELPKDEQVTFQGVPVVFDSVMDASGGDQQRAQDKSERA
jgi:hypothetical protein